MTKANISYTLGTYPTIDLLKFRPGQVNHIYLSSKASADLVSLISGYTSNYSINDKLILRLSKSENTYVVGEFRLYETLLDPQVNHLVLDQVSDMGNLGTIIRTMIGFDVINLALIRPAADIFHPKTIRASMGALFQINFQYFDSFTAYTSSFPRHFYPFISDAVNQLSDVQFSSPYSLIFGNESAGLPEAYQSLGTPVRIQQTARIDSLNLSIAAALGLYHAFIHQVA